LTFEGEAVRVKSGNPPEAVFVAPFSVIQKLAVKRLEGDEATILGDLEGPASFGGGFPDLESSGTVGSEVDPSLVL
jgi:hypothetical protein